MREGLPACIPCKARGHAAREEGRPTRYRGEHTLQATEEGTPANYRGGHTCKLKRRAHSASYTGERSTLSLPLSLYFNVCVCVGGGGGGGGGILLHSGDGERRRGFNLFDGGVCSFCMAGLQPCTPCK